MTRKRLDEKENVISWKQPEERQELKRHWQEQAGLLSFIYEFCVSIHASSAVGAIMQLLGCLNPKPRPRLNSNH
ncbi:hypothetical protein EYC80_005945 [Monilinia laxa]|uniref:Uncharacterized protein n=1 Tax=Monilinia laxa TaxID=61186 RepID=A0A5N6KFL2_MONLA|nr:hypothetical protein EYC80_005945 [Monilinia laxa]